MVSLADYDHVQEVTKEGSKKMPSPGYPLVCVTPCDPHYPKYSVTKERCEEAGINQTQVHFSWEVAAPTDTNGARSPFETVTDTTPYTSVNHMVSNKGRETPSQMMKDFFLIVLQCYRDIKGPILCKKVSLACQ